MPLPPDSIPVSPHVGVGNGVYYISAAERRSFSAQESQEMFDYYDSSMASAGWELIESHRGTRSGDDWAMTWENTGQLVEITLGPVDGARTELQVQLCPPHAPGVCKLSSGYLRRGPPTRRPTMASLALDGPVPRPHTAVQASTKAPNGVPSGEISTSMKSRIGLQRLSKLHMPR